MTRARNLLDMTAHAALRRRKRIVAAAREASAESLAVSELYKVAAVKAHAASDSADTEHGRNYWRLKRDALTKFGEAAEASATGYAVWIDPTNPPVYVIRGRQEARALFVEAAPAEADWLSAEAETLAAENRGEF